MQYNYKKYGCQQNPIPVFPLRNERVEDTRFLGFAQPILRIPEHFRHVNISKKRSETRMASQGEAIKNVKSLSSGSFCLKCTFALLSEDFFV